MSGTWRGAACMIACAAAGALSACRPGEPAPRRPTPPAAELPAAEPAVRVGITVDSAAAVVGAASDFELRANGGASLGRGRAGERWTFTANAAGAVVAQGPSNRVEHSGPIRIVPATAGSLMIGGRRYRGEALILPRAGGRVTAINLVDMEAYLLGVVPREMGRRPATEIEALKAQAIAARTFAIGSLAGRQSLGFDVYATVMDQVYGGIADEDSIVSRAVRETRGEILTYDGQPILAYYSSTCGGTTAAIEDSWPWRAPLPYLKSVSDRNAAGEAYCATSNRYTWSTRWTRDQLMAVLGETLRTHTRGAVASVRRIDDVRMIGRNASERASVRLTADGSDHVLRADSIRWVMRPQPGPAILNSSKLDRVDVAHGSNGIESVEIHGGGWGHAIGMCQVGAMARARAGHTYDRILRAYYTEVQLSRLYR